MLAAFDLCNTFYRGINVGTYNWKNFFECIYNPNDRRMIDAINDRRKEQVKTTEFLTKILQEEVEAIELIKYLLPDIYVEVLENPTTKKYLVEINCDNCYVVDQSNLSLNIAATLSFIALIKAFCQKDNR